VARRTFAALHKQTFGAQNQSWVSEITRRWVIYHAHPAEEASVNLIMFTTRFQVAKLAGRACALPSPAGSLPLVHSSCTAEATEQPLGAAIKEGLEKVRGTHTLYS